MAPIDHVRLTNSEILAKNRDFFIPSAFDAPVRRPPSDYCHIVWFGKTRIAWLPEVKKV